MVGGCWNGFRFAFEVSTIPAEFVEKIFHGVIFGGQLLPSDVPPHDAIHSGGHSAGVVAAGAKGNPTSLGNPASVSVIRVPINGEIRGSDIEGAVVGNDRVATRFPAVLNDHIVGKALDYLVDFVPITIGEDQDAGLGRVGRSVAAKRLNYLGEILVDRGLAANEDDFIPLISGSDCLLNKEMDLLQAHLHGGGSLLAGAIAVDTAKVAGIGDVEFYAAAAAAEFRTQQESREIAYPPDAVTSANPLCQLTQSGVQALCDESRKGKVHIGIKPSRKA